MRVRLGFIGLGNIGREIAPSLCAPGNTVTVHDIAPGAAAVLEARGARAAASPAAVAEVSDLIGVCVQDDAQVVAVMDGILATAQPGALVLIHSTVRVATMQALAAKAQGRGVRVIDAPVSRASGQTTGIVFMVAGETGAVRDAQPYLALCAAQVLETGELGTAMTLKICNNMLTYLQVCGARDVVNLARAAGLDLAHLTALTAANGIASPSVLRTFQRGGQAFAHAEGDAAVAIERMGRISEKDLDCALETGHDLGVPLPSALMARAAIRQAIAAGFEKP